jgi:hypothetical protein
MAGTVMGIALVAVVLSTAGACDAVAQPTANRTAPIHEASAVRRINGESGGVPVIAGFVRG